MYVYKYIDDSPLVFVSVQVTTFKDKNCLYMLLELVQGGELFSLLHNQGGKIPSKNAQFYAGCVVSALSFLHEKYIVYRDLKPENLLIDKQGFCKVPLIHFSSYNFPSLRCKHSLFEHNYLIYSRWLISVSPKW
jgi:serine/threonine protein kinase